MGPSVDCFAPAMRGRDEEFRAAVQHELRTPLNAILGFSDLLAADEALGDRARRYAGHIHASGKRLLAAISTIVELAEASQGADWDAAVRVSPSRRLVVPTAEVNP